MQICLMFEKKYIYLLRIYIYTYLLMDMYIYMYIYMCIYKYIRKYIYICIHDYICMYVCLYNDCSCIQVVPGKPGAEVLKLERL